MTDVADAQLQMHREGLSLERLAKIDRATLGTYIHESLRCKNVIFDHFVNMDMLTLMSERHRNDPR